MAGTEATITARDGGDFHSYLAAPESGSGPGVVIVAPIFGVSSDIRRHADKLAGEGFVAMAPNMFWRDEDSELLEGQDDALERGRARAGRNDIDQGIEDLADVIGAIKTRPDCNAKVAVVGLCFGGPYAFLGAARLGIDAAISFHGSYIEKYLDEAGAITCPLDLHWGDSDEIAPMASIKQIQDAFERVDNAHVSIYEGVVHSYMNPFHEEAYDEAATNATWDSALRLLKSL